MVPWDKWMLRGIRQSNELPRPEQLQGNIRQLSATRWTARQEGSQARLATELSQDLSFLAGCLMFHARGQTTAELLLLALVNTQSPFLTSHLKR